MKNFCEENHTLRMIRDKTVLPGCMEYGVMSFWAMSGQIQSSYALGHFWLLFNMLFAGSYVCDFRICFIVSCKHYCAYNEILWYFVNFCNTRSLLVKVFEFYLCGYALKQGFQLLIVWINSAANEYQSQGREVPCLRLASYSGEWQLLWRFTSLIQR